MSNQPFIASASRPGSGPLIRDVTLVDFVTRIVPTFYPIIVLGARDELPAGVKSYNISATLTGTDPKVQNKLNALTLNQVVTLLGQFTFTLGSGGTTYVISGTAPAIGNPARNGGTFASNFADLCLSDIGELLSQASFKVNHGQNSYQISGQPTSSVGDSFLTEIVGEKSAGYLGIGLHLLQFTLTEQPQPGAPPSSPGAPVTFSVTSNKNHGE